MGKQEFMDEVAAHVDARGAPFELVYGLAKAEKIITDLNAGRAEPTAALAELSVVVNHLKVLAAGEGDRLAKYVGRITTLCQNLQMKNPGR